MACHGARETRESRTFVASQPFKLAVAEPHVEARIPRTSIERGQDLMRALRGRLSGLCQPAYVLDIPGGHGKSPIGPNHLSRDDAGRVRIEDFNGKWHAYPPAT